jgi:hypothetical protein
MNYYKFDNITVSFGYTTMLSFIKNTPEERYKLVYNRICNQCKKLSSDLLNIIIQYLLFGNEWKYSFVWDIQLLVGL